jgi:hypothetical protein
MLVTIGIFSVIFTLTRILRYRRCWWQHLLTIQKSFTLFQITSHGTMNLAPLLYVIETSKGCLLLLIRGLLAVIPMISSVSVIDLLIILLS